MKNHQETCILPNAFLWHAFFGLASGLLLLISATPAPAVQLAWDAFYGPGYYKATAVGVDKKGNVFVTGSSSDYVTIKYSPNGAQLWVKTYNGPGNAFDDAKALAVDSQGNVIVTGESGLDYATVKYSPDGNQLWVKRYNGPANSEDRATALAVDSLGNTVVTGQSANAANNWDYLTIKYDASGNYLWEHRYNGFGSGPDMPCAVAVDGDGHIYVTGTSDASSQYFDITTIKYNPGGTPLWERNYHSTWDDYASALALDRQGNVYVAGMASPPTAQSYITVKYDTNGNVKWAKLYNAGTGPDKATALAVDGQGNVYVTGYSRGSGGNDDFATIKYDKDGNVKWVKRYNGSANGDDKAVTLALDEHGNVYVTGSSYEKTGGSPSIYFPAITTIKYTPAGAQDWIMQYAGVVHIEPRALALDPQANVLVAGYAGLTAPDSYTYLTLKYRQGVYVPLDLLLLY